MEPHELTQIVTEPPQANQPPTTTAATLLVGLALFLLMAGSGVYASVRHQEVALERKQREIERLKQEKLAEALNSDSPSSQEIAADRTLSRLFTSSIVNLSFRTTQANPYSEYEEYSAENSYGDPNAGHQVLFSSLDGVYEPYFIATTKTLSDSTDLQFADAVIGTLDSSSSFTLRNTDPSTMKVTEVEPGMFKVTALVSLDCRPYASSYLLVRPPENSGLKYISFDLGSASLPLMTSDYSDPCTYPLTGSENTISSLDESADVAFKLTYAIEMAKTFSVR